LTHHDLQHTLNRFPDTNDGNTEASQFLWSNRYWQRAALLRRFLQFLDCVHVVDQPSLHAWAKHAQFERDFQNKVKGLGIAVFQWLILRCGVETIKPDVWVINFVKRVVGLRVSEKMMIAAFTDIAPLVGESLPTIDGTIWYFEKMAMATDDSPPLRIVWWNLLKSRLEYKLSELKTVVWHMDLDGKDLLRYSTAGLSITIHASLFGHELTTGMTLIKLRQSLWHEGFMLELLIEQKVALEQPFFEQLKAKLEADGWEVENKLVLEASLDMETDVLVPPETTLVELTEWVDDIGDCVMDVIADLESYNQAYYYGTV
jgi:hypothetical protein